MVADGSTSRIPGDPPPPTDPADALGSTAAAFRVRAQEVAEFASYYVSAQLDRLKLTAINLAMFVVLAAVVAFVGISVVITAGVLLMVGIAGGVGALFHRPWLGDLITAVVILGTLLGGVVVAFKLVTGMSRKKVVAAYEQRKHKQRSSLGTDVDREARR